MPYFNWSAFDKICLQWCAHVYVHRLYSNFLVCCYVCWYGMCHIASGLFQKGEITCRVHSLQLFFLICIDFNYMILFMLTASFHIHITLQDCMEFSLWSRGLLSMCSKTQICNFTVTSNVYYNYHLLSAISRVWIFGYSWKHTNRLLKNASSNIYSI